jgi:hypothetical protein
MKRFITALAGVLLLAACNDGPAVTGPVEPDAQAPSIQSETQAVFDAAVLVSPIGRAQGLTIGVLDEGRTATSALVSFENGSEWQVWRFEKAGGSWVSERFVRSSAFAEPAPQVAGRVAADGYSGRIARISSFANPYYVDDWYVSGMRTAGTFQQMENYSGLTMDQGQFFPGTLTENNTEYSVSLYQWSPFRTTSPSHEWTSTSSSFRVNTTIYNSASARFETHYPEYWRLTYAVSVRTLQPLGAYIVDAEANDSDYRRLHAFLTNTPSSATLSYHWETSPDGITWSHAGNTQNIGPFRIYPTPVAPFYARVTVTASNGQTSQSAVYHFNWTAT